MEKIIEVKGLTKSFGDFKAVDNLDFDVNRGDVYGFLGPNGAGKSTTIRMLLSLVQPDTGTIRIFGKDLSKDRDKIMANIGCIVEKPDFYKYLSARKNLEILGRYNKVPSSKSKIEELLEFVGLAGRGDDLVKGYSHGMRQRLGIAQAMLHDPDLIILDEPTTGLDPQGIIDIRNLIVYLSKDRGKTIFLSSHILHELELVASSMAILNKGKLVIQGELKTLLDDNDRVVEIKTSRPDDALIILKEADFNYSSNINSEGLIEIHLPYNAIPAIVACLVEKGISVYSVESRRRLEDLFLKLTESAGRMKVKVTGTLN